VSVVAQGAVKGEIMQRPEIAVLVSTFQRPLHLRRSLLSLALQRDVTGRMEVIVTDDGSPEVSRPVVEAFAREVDFPVRFTTHEHNGFQLSRCRNEGVAVSCAPYLLFTDGDCILPPDHVRWHLEYRRSGRVVAGDCYRLDQDISENLTDEAIRGGDFLALVTRCERRRLAAKARHGRWYYMLHCKRLPRLTGNNIAVWRTDYDRVNGFDEQYIGWGLEDRDLQLRLSRLGLRFKSILDRTAAYHLWHPPAPSFARNGVGTQNLVYYQRKDIPTRCEHGLFERIQDSDPSLSDEQCLVSAGDRPLLIPFPAATERGSSRKAA
jgi:glycosyltransferase involved in cell wall biosynthesis